MFMRHEIFLGNQYAKQRYDRICSYINKTKLPIPVLEFYTDAKSGAILGELDDGDF